MLHLYIKLKQYPLGSANSWKKSLLQAPERGTKVSFTSEKSLNPTSKSHTKMLKMKKRLHLYIKLKQYQLGSKKSWKKSRLQASEIGSKVYPKIESH